jgi:hypothetical protein
MKPVLVLFSRETGVPAARSALQHEEQVESQSNKEFIQTLKQRAIFWYLFCLNRPSEG